MPSLIPSLLKMKCPVCREGAVFVHKNPYKLKTVGEMHSVCPVCSCNYRPEPGFYFGGAVISYPLMVVFNLAVSIVFYLVVGDVFDHSEELIITMILATLLVAPPFFRYSRIMWLYINYRYGGK